LLFAFGIAVCHHGKAVALNTPFALF